MPVQAAKDFIEKIKSDHKVRDEAAEGKDLVHLGHKHGFTFDRKDFDKAMEENRHEHPEDARAPCFFFKCPPAIPKASGVRRASGVARAGCCCRPDKPESRSTSRRT